MGKRWDYDVPSVEVWQECWRVMKPGGHLLAFAGTRTQHRMAVRIEDAGFEIRDMIAWCYGSGFPKSLDVSKAIDKAAGVEREVLRIRTDGNKGGGSKTYDDDAYVWDKPFAETAPATEAAKQWAGWGTALKPSLEPITVARKPLCGTVAENVLQHGTGGLNVDGCRVAATEGRPLIESKAERSQNAFGDGLNGSRSAGTTTQGRWPANLIHDGSDDVVGLFPDDGEASAARFFYCAKADASERRNSKHPTVKPLALMRYLCRLVCPPDGIVLDPFCGSGTTLEAARLEGFGAIGCELNAEYIADCKERLKQGVLF
jgi:site-specific DNA-methyltransferase (adenine-specific)